MTVRLVDSVVLIGQAGDRLNLSVGAPNTEGWVLGAPSTGALEGWWEPPAPRVESVARPQADGAFAPYQLLVGARIVTITVHHVAKDAASEAGSRALIARLCRGWLRLVVVEAGHVSHVNGFVSAQVKAHHVAGVASTWSIVMTCPDPLKYEGDGGGLDGSLESWQSVSGIWSKQGEGGLLFDLFDQAPRDDVKTTLSATMLFTGGVSSSLTVVNKGSADTWPVLEVAGPVGTASWTLGDHTVTWGLPVPAGQLLRINTQDGMITLGGARIDQSGLIRDGFFALPTGQSQVSVEADEPARFAVRWLNAWI